MAYVWLNDAPEPFGFFTLFSEIREGFLLEFKTSELWIAIIIIKCVLLMQNIVAKFMKTSSLVVMHDFIFYAAKKLAEIF